MTIKSPIPRFIQEPDMVNLRKLRNAARAAALVVAACHAGVSYAWGLKMSEDFSGADIREQRSLAFSLLTKLGEPVHERMLFEALGCSYPDPDCLTGLEESHGITSALLLRGLRWPDNPAFKVSTGRVGSECKNVILRPGHSGERDHSTTVECWFKTMVAGSAAANEVSTNGRRRANSSYAFPLRSHYADFQFMHGMAPYGQPARKTKELIMAWAELTYSVATADISPTATLPQLIAQRPSLKVLRHYLGPRSIGSVLDYREDDVAATRALALGALLHMVQDSFAHCHTDRATNGDIVQFLTYDGQRPAFHAIGDKPDAHVAQEGWNLARKATKTVWTAFKSDRSFRQIEPTLDGFFKLAANSRTASPGRCGPNPAFE